MHWATDGPFQPQMNEGVDSLPHSAADRYERLRQGVSSLQKSFQPFETVSGLFVTWKHRRWAGEIVQWGLHACSRFRFDPRHSICYPEQWQAWSQNAESGQVLSTAQEGGKGRGRKLSGIEGRRGRLMPSMPTALQGTSPLSVAGCCLTIMFTSAVSTCPCLRKQGRRASCTQMIPCMPLPPTAPIQGLPLRVTSDWLTRAVACLLQVKGAACPDLGEGRGDQGAAAALQEGPWQGGPGLPAACQVGAVSVCGHSGRPPGLAPTHFHRAASGHSAPDSCR